MNEPVQSNPSVEKIKSRVVADIGQSTLDKLTFETLPDRVKILSGFLKDKQEFAKICTIVKDFNGERISDGKDSRWEVKF